ncbi:MAG: ABC transporter permease [Candidatus Tectimicrobiota bacterium]|nr:MAG: ABC transporter permease [Candidatus Tectomicrobia bacterium]
MAKQTLPESQVGVVSYPREVAAARPWSLAALRRRLATWLEDERVLFVLLVAPTLLILVAFLAIPFFWGVWLSVSDKVVGRPGAFVGLQNFFTILDSSIFRRTVQNTFVYTGIATIFKLVLGMALALLLNRHFRFNRLLRASMLLPWIVPTVLSTLAWLWIFDATYSVLNWILREIGLARLLWQLGIAPSPRGFVWLGTPGLAMGSVIAVNVWRGFPFFAITLLAGLQTIDPELHEAAEIDGAGGWARFWYITLPLLRPILTVVLLFSIIVTFADFQLVYVLTRGGPHNSTHLFATLAYQVGVISGKLGQGAAISLFMFPVLLLAVILQLRYIRRET